MARSARFDLPDWGAFHITARGVAGCAIYEDDYDRLRFIRLLRLATRIAPWRLLVYCLMTNHFHLVLLAERESVSRGMHALNFRYAQAFNRRHDRRGHLFEDRFHAQVVRDELHLGNACAYVLENAHRAGLCEPYEAWPWTGGEYAY